MNLGTALQQQSMFGQSDMGRTLVEFRAGKMTLNGTTVTADPKKGMLSIWQSVDSLLHLSWRERNNEKHDIDMIIFPEEARVEKVPQCTTGRVLLVRFTNASTKLFFWMQEPKDDKDDEYLTKMNNLLASPPGSDDADASRGGMSQNQLMQLLASAAAGGPVANTPPPNSSVATPAAPSRSTAATTPSTAAPTPTPASGATPTPTATGTPTPTPTAGPTPTPAAPAATPASGPTGTVDLSQLLASSLGQMGSRVSLRNILNASEITPLLESETVQQRLFPHLPEECRSPHALRDIIHSPQFQQALDALTSAMNGENYAAIVSSLGLDPNASPVGGVEAFVRALQDEADKEKGDKMDES